MRLLVAAIDFSALGKVVAASLVAGVVITAAFSGVLYGLDVVTHAQREGPNPRVVLAGVLAGISGLVFVAAVVAGVVVMTTK